MRSVFVNVFEHQDGSQALGNPHPNRKAAEAVMGPVGKWFWGKRPVYRLRVTLKPFRR